MSHACCCLLLLGGASAGLLLLLLLRVGVLDTPSVMCCATVLCCVGLCYCVVLLCCVLLCGAVCSIRFPVTLSVPPLGITWDINNVIFSAVGGRSGGGCV